MIRSCRAAFTLIEILVTVGILCILAAIAVPNLIDAQTRAKVARVKSDHRVIAEAMERCWVDNRAYPGLKIYCGLHRRCNVHETASHTMCEHRPAGWFFQCINMTTPIAYLSTTDFPDPFIRTRAHKHMKNGSMRPNLPGAGLLDRDKDEIVPAIGPDVVYVPLGEERDPVHLTYQYAAFSAYDSDYEVLDNDIEFEGRVEDSQTHRPGYYIVSVGPDNTSGPDYFSGKIWNVGAYTLLNDHTDDRRNTFDCWKYDPTNGVRSNGDIIGYGGYYDQ